MKNGKATGPGEITPEFQRSKKLHRIIHTMFEKPINETQLHKEWTEANVTSIFKEDRRR